MHSVLGLFQPLPKSSDGHDSNGNDSVTSAVSFPFAVCDIGQNDQSLTCRRRVCHSRVLRPGYPEDVSVESEHLIVVDKDGGCVGANTDTDRRWKEESHEKEVLKPKDQELKFYHFPRAKPGKDVVFVRHLDYTPSSERTETIEKNSHTHCYSESTFGGGGGGEIPPDDFDDANHINDINNCNGSNDIEFGVNKPAIPYTWYGNARAVERTVLVLFGCKKESLEELKLKGNCPGLIKLE